MNISNPTTAIKLWALNKNTFSFLTTKIIPIFLLIFCGFVVFNFMYAYNVSTIAQLMAESYSMAKTPINEQIYSHMVGLEKSTIFSSVYFKVVLGIMSALTLILYREKHYKTIKIKPIHVISSFLLMVSLVVSGLGIALYSNRSVLEQTFLQKTVSPLKTSPNISNN